MTIKQQGGIFGRNPTFNDVDAASVDINSGATGGSPLTLTTTASGHNIDMIDSTSTARIRNVGGRLHITADVNDEAASSAIRFYIDNTRMVDIDDSGNIVFNSSGQGIDFSATSGTGTSELFDDYEEGTYTVSLYDAASAGNASPTTTTGYYTKIGRVVTCSFGDLNDISTAGMSAGVILYMSLPFSAAQNASGSMAIGVVDARQTAGQGYVVPIVQSGDSRVRFYGCESGSAMVNIRTTELTSGTSDFRNFTITYITS